MSQVDENTVPHILELTLAAKRTFFDSFDLIFFDCDGVVWLVVGTIPHTHEAINLLKDAGKQCRFVSNNSVRSEPEYLEKFKNIGVKNVSIDDIVHPAKAMARFAKTHYAPDARFFSICSNTANNYFREKGLQLEELEITEHLTPVTLTERVRLHGHRVSAVLFDINLNLNFAQLARASMYLKQGDCDLIAGATDSYLPMAADVTTIGFLYFERLLAAQHQSETITFAKPSPALGDILKDLYKIQDPKRVLFIGDALKQDIGFGKKCGYQTLLVLTGTATKEAMLNATDEQCPDFYADSLFDFVEFMKDLK